LAVDVFASKPMTAPETGAPAAGAAVPADLLVDDVVDVYALGANGKGSRLVVPCLTVRSIGPITGSAPGAAAPATGAPVSGAVIGFDADPSTASDLYKMVGAGEQPALYDHNPTVGCPR